MPRIAVLRSPIQCQRCVYIKMFRLAVVLSVVFALASSPALADHLDQSRSEVRALVSTSSAFTNTLAQLAGITVAPEVSSLNLTIDFGEQGDVNLSLTKLPLRHYFRSEK